MITTHRHTGLANAGKNQQLLALFPAFRDAFGALGSIAFRELLDGQPLTGWRVMTDLPFQTSLSARQMKSVQNQSHAALSSWQEKMVDAVRGFITGSSLPEHRRTVLYRINANRAWWAKSLDLPWSATSDGELVPIGPAAARKRETTSPGSVVWLPVAAEDLFLARRLAKQAMRRHAGLPDLRRVRTLNLDSIVAKPEPANGHGPAGWWVKVATLTRGKPVWLPLARNTYFDAEYAKNGRLCGAIQLHLVTDPHGNPIRVDASLIIERPDAPARTTGTELGLDWGMSSALFATSDGQLLGQKMLHTLAQWDIRLNQIAADLQRRGIPLKTDTAYQQLNRRIRDYVTNEIGRLLNQIAAREGDDAVRAIVVERLDFRGGGLSRRLNRLITRCGRGVMKSRLKALEAKYGIVTHEVGSAHTSRECSGCHFVSKSNRRGRHFKCRFCGKKIHADINAARTVKGRRSLQLDDLPGKSGRGTTLRLLDQRHQQHWGLRPAGGADPVLAGHRGETAA